MKEIKGKHVDEVIMDEATYIKNYESPDTETKKFIERGMGLTK